MKPLRELHIPSKAFGSETVCLGTQVAAVVGVIAGIRPDLNWYAADVQGVGYPLLPKRDPVPVLIGDAETLSKKALAVEQFDTAVFAGVPGGSVTPRFRDGGLWTEDEEMADLGDAIVEVRTFDTSYISVASSDPSLLQALETTDFRRLMQAPPLASD